jgi:hypothetical protein
MYTDMLAIKPFQELHSHTSYSGRTQSETLGSLPRYISLCLHFSLFSQIEEHEKALDILVHNLKDFKGAEMYCINNTEGKGLKYKHNLFHTLLAVYLDPKLE